MAHALLSPSGWATWGTCPGSVSAQEGIPDSTSVYADEGTAAHWVLEQVLTDLYVLGEDNVSASRYLGRDVNCAEDGEEPRYVTVNQEMCNHVDTVVEYVQQRVEEMAARNGQDVQVFAERRVNPEALIGSGYSPGTADVTLLTPTEVEVIDFKYGQGVGVEVYDPDEGPNGQLMLYMAGVVAAHAKDLRAQHKVDLAITVAQPRYDHPDGPIRSWKHLLRDLYEFADRVKGAVRRIEEEPEVRVASEKGCRWCRAKGGHPATGLGPCKAYADWSFSQFAGPSDFSVETFLDDLDAFAQKVDTSAGQVSLSEEEIINLLDAADLVRGLLKAVEEWAVEALETGAAGAALRARYKLVEGRTQRKWAFDEDSVAAALKRIRWKDEATGKTTGLRKPDIFQEKLASPAQIERKLTGVKKGLKPAHWEAFRNLVDKPRGSAKLAPVTDPGEDISGARDPQQMFPETLTSSTLDDLL